MRGNAISMIGMSEHTKPHNSNKQPMDFVTVGERGQVVIPAAIRERVGLQPGDKLMVFTKHSEMICLVSTSSMQQLVDVLTQQLAEIDSPIKINNQETK
jgi:AbrB family looped-hinge helix DNA binding protein